MCMFKALHRDAEDSEQHRPLSKEEFYRFYEILDLTWIQVLDAQSLIPRPHSQLFNFHTSTTSSPGPIPNFSCNHIHVHVCYPPPIFQYTTWKTGNGVQRRGYSTCTCTSIQKKVCPNKLHAPLVVHVYTSICVFLLPPNRASMYTVTMHLHCVTCYCLNKEC